MNVPDSAISLDSEDTDFPLQRVLLDLGVQKRCRGVGLAGLAQSQHKVLHVHCRLLSVQDQSGEIRR